MGIDAPIGAEIGRDEIVTAPRSSARWSSVLPARILQALSQIAVQQPAKRPRPRRRRWRLGADLSSNAQRSVDRGGDGERLGPARDGDRAARQRPADIALPSSSASGLSRLPARSRGACRSIVSRIAVSATAIGAVTVDMRVAALERAVAAAWDGRLARGETGASSAHRAAARNDEHERRREPAGAEPGNCIAQTASMWRPRRDSNPVIRSIFRPNRQPVRAGKPSSPGEPMHESSHSSGAVSA